MGSFDGCNSYGMEDTEFMGGFDGCNPYDLDSSEGGLPGGGLDHPAGDVARFSCGGCSLGTSPDYTGDAALRDRFGGELADEHALMWLAHSPV